MDDLIKKHSAIMDKYDPVGIDIRDLHQAAEVELNVTGINAKSAVGETLTAPKVDSVNTFEAPNTVVPKPISARAQGGKLILQLEPKSVTVVSVEQ
jgi:alpha-N-arabinofuranosidase